jgi:hypothetical protein
VRRARHFATGDEGSGVIMRGRIAAGLALTVAMLIGFGISSSRAANLFEMNFGLSGPRYEAVVPLCDAPGPLSKIQSRFSEKESTFWNSALQIVAFEDIREVAFRPSHAPEAIPRRFCRGRVLTSDGVHRQIHYLIGEDTGWLGVTWGVEWCVTGLDRNWAYNPSCKMARP